MGRISKPLVILPALLALPLLGSAAGPDPVAYREFPGGKDGVYEPYGGRPLVEPTSSHWAYAARNHVARGEYAPAARAYAQAIALRGDDPGLYRELGRTYTRLGQEAEAARCHLLAYRLSGDLGHLLQSARSSYADGQVNESVGKLEQLLARDQHRDEAWMLLGRCREQQGRDADAKACYARVRVVRLPFDLPEGSLIEGQADKKPAAPRKEVIPGFAPMFPEPRLFTDSAEPAVLADQLRRADRFGLPPLDEIYDLGKHAPPGAPRMAATEVKTFTPPEAGPRQKAPALAPPSVHAGLEEL